ncbi:hypothetical protein FJ952_04440 [Mesorhizobium sp. B2-4-10]|nr:hypothetical protein FJ952_04440 [Mesorhizobium sp. B2-4-10]
MKGRVPSHPPLPCRASPPQGGRLAGLMSRQPSTIGDWRRPRRHPISPLAGEMPGRAEGGAVPPT